ncbi:GDP-mannose 4,6-dehydratase [Candidatus Babeliales bacterium]|nr:GDP-mannose 4,6-dehydratase [Candidatus Babeliales bacterium]
MQNLDKPKIALITGITGQDGAYLSEFLLNKNYKVIGFVRDNDDYSKLEYLKIKNKITFENCNLLDLLEVINIIKKYEPDEIYNFAAQSSVSLSLKEPETTLKFNINSVINILESIRLFCKKTKFFQASSCEMFGAADNLPVTENTQFKPLNSYSISKIAAHLITLNYRNIYKIFACSGILFNHESYLRGEDFFIKKIIKQALEIKNNKRENLIVGNLNIKRDLGYAPDYVQAMYLMLQSERADDFIISSGKSVSLQEIIFYVFDKLDLKKEKIIIDKNLYRICDIEHTLGDNSKIKKTLDWNYDKDFYEVLDLLIEEEFNNF